VTSPICPGGTRAKPGVVGIIIIAGALFELWLARRAKWLAPFIPFISPFVFDPSEVCAGEPPEFPQFSIDELGQLITGGLVVKTTQAIQHLAWWEYCECIGTTPAPPSLLPPAGLPAVPNGPVEACESVHVVYSRAQHPFENLNVPLYGTSSSPAWLVPNTTSVTLRGQIEVRPPDSFQNLRNVFSVAFFRDDGTTLTVNTTLDLDPLVNGGRVTQQLVLPAGTTRVFVKQDCQPGGTCQEGRVASIDMDFQCGNNPNALQPECCPPDPTLIGKLDRLLLQMALVVARLGPITPLEVISTTPITGEGQMPLAQGARQVKFDITTVGPGVKSNPYANPDRLMRMASMRFGNDFGWLRRQSLDNADNLFSVPLDSQVVSWSLSAGTSGSLVQLGQLL
jgi:hypothetical protein